MLLHTHLFPKCVYLLLQALLQWSNASLPVLSYSYHLLLPLSSLTHTHTHTSHQTEIFKSADIRQCIFTLGTGWAHSVCHLLDYKGPRMRNQTLLLDWSRLIMMERRKVRSRQGLSSRVPLGGTQINPRIILPACSNFMSSIQWWHLYWWSALYSTFPKSTEHTNLDSGSTI